MATTTSDSGGNYEFDNLFPGTFTIEEILQSGWTQTQPVNPDYYTITTQSGMNVTGLNFGNFKTFSVSGSVYNDVNGDGLRNGGDPGLQGWTVNLIDSSGNVLATQTTDANGNYTFTGVGARQRFGGRGRADQLGADPAAVPDGVHVHRQERP